MMNKIIFIDKDIAAELSMRSPPVMPATVEMQAMPRR
jgi:hypothetical protein